MEDNNTKKDILLVCNKCNKNIKKNSHNYYEDFLQVEKRWNYHSSFDNEVHKFNLCEECYKTIIGDFLVPVNIEE